MMEDHAFCDTCPGCTPAIFDMKTRRPIPDDDPRMVKIMRMWREETTYDQRKAYIEVTLHHSRLPSDLRLAREIMAKLGKCLAVPVNMDIPSARV